MQQKIKELDPKQLITKRRPDLECQVCSMIAKTPISCPDCDKVFCRNCLTTNICPICNSESISLDKKFNKILMKYLREMKFTCENCPEQYSYDEHENHLKGHIYAECCESHLSDETQIKLHLENDCMEMAGNCKCCKSR